MDKLRGTAQAISTVGRTLAARSPPWVSAPWQFAAPHFADGSWAIAGSMVYSFYGA